MEAHNQMPAIASVEKEIAEFEGFKVEIRPRLKAKAPAMIPKYKGAYERIARNSHSVADWLRLRFAPRYPDFDATVLSASGKRVNAKTRLDRLRAASI